MVSANRWAPFFFLRGKEHRRAIHKLKGRRTTTESRRLNRRKPCQLFLLVFLTRARAHPLVFLLHFYIFPHNGVTDCPLMYVERAFIYIVLHYFCMFSVFSFRPSMLLILPFRVYEKKAKENTFAREENFCTREENKFAREEKLGNLLAWQLSTANETSVICK